MIDGEWRWSFARKQVIYDVFEPDEVYLLRWRFDTPLGSVFLHSIKLPDRDPNPHTHPFSKSVSFILKGAYEEHRGPTGDQIRTLRPGRVNRLSGTDVHRIDSTRDGQPVWTLFYAGKPHGRGWGFVVDGVYEDHKTYLARRDAGEKTVAEAP